MPRARLTIALLAIALSMALAAVAVVTDVGQTAGIALVASLERLLAQYFWATLFVYVATMAVVLSLTLPLATLMTVTAGFLFGAGLGGLAALSGMTLAAVLTFGAMRALGVQRDAETISSARMRALYELLDRNALFYVVLLRVVPAAPCFTVNAGAALTQIDFGRYAIASTIGLVPASFVYAGIGAGLNDLVDARGVLGPELLLEPTIALPLLGMASLVGLTWLLRRRLPGLRPES